METLEEKETGSWGVFAFLTIKCLERRTREGGGRRKVRFVARLGSDKAVETETHREGQSEREGGRQTK